MTENRQVWSIHIREDVGAEYRFAFAIADSYIADRSALRCFHHASVRIFKSRNTHHPRSFDRCGCDRVWLRRGLDKYWSSRPTIHRVWHAMPIFQAAIKLQDGFIT